MGLTLFLPQVTGSQKCTTTPRFMWLVLGIEPRALHPQGEHSVNRTSVLIAKILLFYGNKRKQDSMTWHPEPGRLRLEDHRLEFSLGYTVRAYLEEKQAARWGRAHRQEEGLNHLAVPVCVLFTVSVVHSQL